MMFNFLCRKNFPACLKEGTRFVKRFFLSEAYQCTKAWDNRLKYPVFDDVNFGLLHSELEKSCSLGSRISVLDVDIFACGMTNFQYQNELEDILMKLRQNPETSIMYESTSHAVIRLYLSHEKKEDLFNMMSQPLIYGIFPNVYLSIFMMDKFLKDNDPLSALKVAVLQMLQDDCNHPILRTMAVYSCIKYLNSSVVWEAPKEEVNEDEEIQKVRVPFARNDYFDDHFDVVNPNHLVGKTMIAFGKVLEGPIGTSSQLIGLIVNEKLDKAKSFLECILEKKMTVYKEAIEKGKLSLSNKLKCAAAEKEEAEESAAENPGFTSDKAEIINLLDEVNNKYVVAGNLESEAEKCVKKEVAEHENNFVEAQCLTYKQWEEEREKNIQSELKEKEMTSALEEITKVRKQLADEEQKIFYFDHEEEYELTAAENEMRKKNVVYYTPKPKKNRPTSHKARNIDNLFLYDKS